MAKRKPDLTADFWGMARSYLHGHLKKVRRASPKTVDAYREAIECYLSFLSCSQGIERAAVDFECFERPLFKAWVTWMQEERGYAAKTVALRVTGAKSFLRWCSDEDVSLAALYDGVRTISPPKAPRKPVEYLGDDELSAVLGAHSGDTQKSRRNRMIVVLLYETGARVSELVGIGLDDLRLSKPAHVTLLGKGAKSRVVPLGDKCVEHLKVYLAEFHPGKPDGRRPLFYSNHMGVAMPLSTDTVARVLKEAGSIARASCPTVPDRIHCHLMRKSRAMALYKADVPLPLIMQLLGHESMSTTSSFYAFATEDMMVRAMDAAYPKVISEPSGWLTEERRQALYSLR